MNLIYGIYGELVIRILVTVVFWGATLLRGRHLFWFQCDISLTLVWAEALIKENMVMVLIRLEM